MMRAMELLAQDTIPIEAIAQSVGYSSVSAFTTAFTNRAGLSAGEYRHRNRDALQSCWSQTDTAPQQRAGSDRA